MNRLLAPLLVALLAAAPSFAFAHVSLEQNSAQAGSTYKAVFRVPHGCDGSPTRAITVFLPEGFVGAKPMPKAGWKLETKSEKLAHPYDSHGTKITERVAVVSWSGGRLLDSEYDEFIVRASLPKEAGSTRIRVLQECEKGATDWNAAPTPENRDPAHPAPKLDILPSGASGGHHH
ncbi:YcnI family copper-binding membrane protein [Uliginosibacterium sp. H1]|uniref:YcnI family copper-binding membrane protein n=1 Tax=Uliginosibacterium sp. H1 TaxID=3114757 RepID=UPI002E178F79|nr:YcnI family protein [Uliginosibacterium sp. H1]